MGKYCSNCGSVLEDDEKFCPSCGSAIGCHSENPQNQYACYGDYIGPYKKKSEGLALILSFLFPGLGQLYTGRIGRGLIFLFSYLPLNILAIIAIFTLMPFETSDFNQNLTTFIFLMIILLIVSFSICIYSMYDAYKGAKKYNEVLYRTGSPPW